jgi:hypothetical protein
LYRLLNSVVIPLYRTGKPDQFADRKCKRHSGFLWNIGDQGRRFLGVTSGKDSPRR